MQILLGYNELGERERERMKRKTETLRFVIIITRDPSDSCACLCAFECRSQVSGQVVYIDDEKKKKDGGRIRFISRLILSTAYLPTTSTCCCCYSSYPTARLEQHGQSSVELDEIASICCLRMWVCVTVYTRTSAYTQGRRFCAPGMRKA